MRDRFARPVSVAQRQRVIPSAVAMTAGNSDGMSMQGTAFIRSTVIGGSAMFGLECQERRTSMRDDDVRAALRRHWASSDTNDFKAEHEIYRADAVLEYPQSGERIRSRRSIQASRTAQPNSKRFTVRRMVGGGDLWVTELVMTYDEQPFYVVSIMEFDGAEVVRETQYFSDPFEPGSSRAQWVEPMS
jgi:hypothetical protein